MAMPQTRFVGIRDNHNHYTSLYLLFSIITDRPIANWCRFVQGMLSLEYSWLAYYGRNSCCPLSVNYWLLYDPHATQKASIGMYSGYDYLLPLFVYLCTDTPIYIASTLQAPKFLKTGNFVNFLSIYVYRVLVFDAWSWSQLIDDLIAGPGDSNFGTRTLCSYCRVVLYGNMGVVDKPQAC